MAACMKGGPEVLRVTFACRRVLGGGTARVWAWLCKHLHEGWLHASKLSGAMRGCEELRASRGAGRSECQLSVISTCVDNCLHNGSVPILRVLGLGVGGADDAIIFI